MFAFLARVLVDGVICGCWCAFWHAVGQWHAWRDSEELRHGR